MTGTLRGPFKPLSIADLQDYASHRTAVVRVVTCPRHPNIVTFELQYVVGGPDHPQILGLVNWRHGRKELQNLM